MCVSGECSVLKSKCVCVCLCVCVCGSGDLMGFPAQQNAPARLTPPTCSSACPHKHTLFVSIRPPAAGSFIRWLDTPRCVLLLANAQQRIRGADNHHRRHTGGKGEIRRGGGGRKRSYSNKIKMRLKNTQESC